MITVHWSTMNLSLKTHIYLNHPLVLLTKLLLTFSITSYQPIYLKKVRKEARKSDSNKNANNVVYILRDPVIKSVNGGNVSDYTNVKVRSRLGGTTEDLIDYVKAIAWTKPKMLVIHTIVGWNKWSTEWYEYHQEGQKSDTEYRQNWHPTKNSNCFFWNY